MMYFVNGKELRIEGDQSIVIVFESDNERLAFANQIATGYEPKEGHRFYGIFPEEMTDEQMTKILDTVRQTL